MGMTLNDLQTRALQRFLLGHGANLGDAMDDGVGGPMTHAAFDRIFAGYLPQVQIGRTDGPPEPDEASMIAYYGQPGDESQLVPFKMPYEMCLAWDRGHKMTWHRCHRRMKAPLEAALADVLKHFGPEGIDRHGLNLYAGCYNHRPVRGGTTTSKHAWGAAIDLNPDANGNSTPWHPDRIGQPGYATMPLAAVEIFEAHGFKHGGRAWGRDAMHFQYTR